VSDAGATDAGATDAGATGAGAETTGNAAAGVRELDFRGAGVPIEGASATDVAAETLLVQAAEQAGVDVGSAATGCWTGQGRTLNRLTRKAAMD